MASLAKIGSVLPALSFEQILGRAQLFGEPRPLRDRLVSVAFANPTSPIWRDLAGNRGFLDARSGTEWDLFFAGLSGFAPDPRSRHPVHIDQPLHSDRDFSGYYNPELFNEVAEAVEGGHQRVMGPSGNTWRYRGGTDLVSFMVYDREPDWASLKFVPLYTDDGTRLTLIHVVEGLARWQQEGVDPRLAPGEFSPAGLGRETELLIAALGWSASAVVGGVLGDAAFELVKQVL